MTNQGDSATKQGVGGGFMPSVSNDHLARARQAYQGSLRAIRQARSGDKPDNDVPGRLKWCRWGDGRHTTRNISEICDACWRDSDFGIFWAYQNRTPDEWPKGSQCQ